MKYYALNAEEKKIEKDFDQKKFVRVKHAAKETARYRESARAILAKTRNINIRLSDRDVLSLKARAAQKGLPYQTLIASVLHQYSSGRIREADNEE